MPEKTESELLKIAIEEIYWRTSFEPNSLEEAIDMFFGVNKFSELVLNGGFYGISCVGL